MSLRKLSLHRVTLAALALTFTPPLTGRSLAQGWSGWSEVPGGGLTVSGPSAASYQGRVYLAVQGTDDVIYWNVASGSGWSGWSYVPNGQTATGPALSLPYLFVQGYDNAIYFNFLSGNRWLGWSRVPGGVLTYS